MAIKTQGTELYVLAPATGESGTLEVLAIGCVTSMSPGGNPAEQIDITCLSETTRSFMRGLRTPGQMTMSINADPKDASHVRLFELSQYDNVEDLTFAVGWSDGTVAPTLGTGDDDFELPASRTWFTFKGYISDFPLDFTGNAVVTAEIAVQRSGPGAWTVKTGA